MKERGAVYINFGRYKGSIGVIKEIKNQDPFDMLTVSVNKVGDLTLFENEVRWIGFNEGG